MFMNLTGSKLILYDQAPTMCTCLYTPYLCLYNNTTHTHLPYTHTPSLHTHTHIYISGCYNIYVTYNYMEVRTFVKKCKYSFHAFDK